jgi:hypothetical protein
MSVEETIAFLFPDTREEPEPPVIGEPIPILGHTEYIRVEVVEGLPGPPGPEGPEGPAGPASTVPGPPGQGVPEGGDTGQLLAKASAGLYDTVWVEPEAGGGGTAILDGIATPDAQVGAVGNYYLDTDDHILFGPKLPGSYLPAQVLYTSQSPEFSGGNQIGSWGLDITVQVDGRITGMRYFRDISVPAETTSTTLNLWDSVGNLLTTVDTIDEPNGAGWRAVWFVTPVPVTAGQKVRASWDAPDPGRKWPFNQPGAPITNGRLTSGASYYVYGLPGYPNTPESDAQFFVDILFEETVTSPWPVALVSSSSSGTDFDQAEADTLYVKLTGDETIAGVKTFTDSITVDSAGPANVVADRGSTNNFAQFECRTLGVQKWTVGTFPGGTENFRILNTTAAADALLIDNASNRIIVAGNPTAPLGVATKGYIDARTPQVTVATTAPATPAVNDIWVDTT